MARPSRGLTWAHPARHTFGLRPWAVGPSLPAPVAQLDRAQAYEAWGSLFESGRARRKIPRAGRAQPRKSMQFGPLWNLQHSCVSMSQLAEAHTEPESHSAPNGLNG